MHKAHRGLEERVGKVLAESRDVELKAIKEIKKKRKVVKR